MQSNTISNTPVAIEKPSRFMNWWSKQPILTKLIIHQVWMTYLTVGLFYQIHVVCEFHSRAATSQVVVGIFLGSGIFWALTPFIGTSVPLIERSMHVAVLTLAYLCTIFCIVSLYTNGVDFEKVVAVIAIPLASAWAMKRAKERFDYYAFYWVRDDKANRMHILIALATQSILTSSIIIIFLPGTFNNI